jgi:hypothetical protein
VAVLPPPGGWETESGISALGAVRYAEWKVKDSPDGVAGRDIRFLKEPPLSEENAEERVTRWRENGVAAVLSLGGADDVSLLRPLLGRSGPVFLSAYGEGSGITEGGVPLPMMFALDLYRDFRIVAFAEYAKRSLDRRNGVAILGDRFDPSLERFARNLGDMLSSSGLSVTHFWLAGAGPDSFRMIEDEAISDGVSVLVSWAGSMVVRDIWRAVRRKEGAFRIWYGGEPAGSFFPLTEFWPQIRRFPWRGTGPLSPWGGKFGGAPGLSSGMQAPPAGRTLPAGGFLRVSEGGFT